MVSQKQMYSIVKEMVGSNDVVAVNMSLVRFTGSWPAGVMLSQLLYWSDKTRISGGWICKTHDEWKAELMLSKDQVRSTVKKLETLGIVESAFKKFDGTPKPHYRINELKFKEMFLAFAEGGKFRGSENPTVGKPEGSGSENPTVKGGETLPSTLGKSDLPLTDTTTDTYSETTTENKNSAPDGGVFLGGPCDQEEVETFPAQPEEEKEKGCGEKEKEDSIRTYYQRYKDTWWKFYQDENGGQEPPHSWRNPTLFGGLKKIQQDLAAEFGGDEERAYQEFVHILSGWQHPKNYHRHRLKPEAMHRNLVEIRRILREQPQKVKENIENVPCVQEALEIYRQAFLEHKDLPPSIDEARDLPLLAKTLEYLKSIKPDSDWEYALQSFEFICTGWPVLEMHDKFYEENFTIRFINGSISKIIGIFRTKQQKQSELTTTDAEAWLARNGLN